MILQAKEHAGAIGSAVTGTAAFTAWTAKALPFLQLVSVSVSIVVGVLTAVWYIRKLRKGE